MIELASALAASLVALGWALWAGRLLLRRSPFARTDAARIGPARSALQSLIGPSSRALAVLALLLGFLAFIAVGIVRSRTVADPTASTLAFGGWLALAFLLGAIVTTATAHLGALAALRLASAPPGRPSPPSVLARVVSASSLGAVVPSFLAFLVIVALCTAALVATGGFVVGRPAAPAAVWGMAQLVVAYGAGTALGSLVFRLAGGWFDAASSVTPAQSRSAVLAAAVGFGPQHAADLVGTWSVGGVSALLPAAAVAASHATVVHSPLAVALFPLVALAFALMSSAIATAVIRIEEDEAPLGGVVRGLGVCVVLCAGSLLGVSHWVFDRLWTGPFAAGLVGLASAVAALWVGGVLDGTGAGDGSAQRVWLNGWVVGRGFERGAGLLAVALLCFFGGARIVGVGAMSQAGTLGATAAVVGFLSPAPFVLVGAGFGWLGRVAVGARDTGAERSSAARVLAACRGYAAAGAVLSGLVALQGYSLVASSYAPPSSPQTQAAGPSIIAAAALTGLALVMLIAGHLFRSAARITRAALSSSGADASSGAGTEGLAHGAVRQGVASTLVMLGLSGAGWLLASGMWGRGTGRALVETTSAWLVLVVAAGGALAVVLGGGRPEVSNPGKSAVDGSTDSANNLAHGAAVVNDPLGIPYGYVAGPALHALARLLPAVVLALAPLVH